VKRAATTIIIYIKYRFIISHIVLYY